MRNLITAMLVFSLVQTAGATVNGTNVEANNNTELRKQMEKITIEVDNTTKKRENPVVGKVTKKNKKNADNKGKVIDNVNGSKDKVNVYKKINFQAGQNIVAGNSQVQTFQGVKAINAQAVVKAFFSNSGSPVTALNYSNKGSTQKQVQSRPQFTQVKETTTTKQIEGYCYFDRDIEMTTPSLPVEIPCTFEDFDALVSGKLLADPSSASLLFKPEVLILDNGKRIPVKGYAMTQDRSSLNIADEVNRQYLKKIATAMASAGATGVLQGYREYVRNKYSTTYVTGDTTVTDANYPANYPWIVGMLSALDAGVNAITSIIKSEMTKVPVIFKIYKGKGIYVSLTVKSTNVPAPSRNSAVGVERGRRDLLTGRSLTGECYLIQPVSLEEGETTKGSLACRFPSVNVSGVLEGSWTADKRLIFTPEKFSTNGKVYTASGSVNVKFRIENGLYVADGERFSANITVGRRIQ